MVKRGILSGTALIICVAFLAGCSQMSAGRETLTRMAWSVQQTQSDLERLDWFKAIVEGIYRVQVNDVVADKSFNMTGSKIQAYRVNCVGGKSYLVATQINGDPCLSEDTEHPRFRNVSVRQNEIVLCDYVESPRNAVDYSERALEVMKALELGDKLSIKRQGKEVIERREVEAYAMYRGDSQNQPFGYFAVDAGLDRCYYKNAVEGIYRAVIINKDGKYAVGDLVQENKFAASSVYVAAQGSFDDAKTKQWVEAIVRGVGYNLGGTVKEITRFEPIEFLSEKTSPYLVKFADGKRCLVANTIYNGTFFSEDVKNPRFRQVKITTDQVLLGDYSDHKTSQEEYAAKVDEILGDLDLGKDLIAKESGTDFAEHYEIAVYEIVKEGGDDKPLGYIGIDAGLDNCYYKQTGKVRFRKIEKQDGKFIVGNPVRNPEDMRDEEWLSALIGGAVKAKVTKIELSDVVVELNGDEIVPYRVECDNDKTYLVATLPDYSNYISEEVKNPKFKTVTEYSIEIADIEAKEKNKEEKNKEKAKEKNESN